MQEDIKRVTLDSNVLISAVKENEEYSKDCREILNFVGKLFILYQPTLCITELYNAIYRKYLGDASRRRLRWGIGQLNVCSQTCTVIHRKGVSL